MDSELQSPTEQVGAVQRKRLFAIGAAAALVIAAAFLFAAYVFFLQAPQRNAPGAQFVITLGESPADVSYNLATHGFISHPLVFDIAFMLRGAGLAHAGGYDVSSSMSAWQIASVLSRKPSSVWVVIPEGLRKEQIAQLLGEALGWSDAQVTEFITKDTEKPDYTEGVYFPDTYLMPVGETPLQAAERLQAQFDEVFAPYAKEAIAKNIKWTTVLKLASIIQREAAGATDMPLISGILWNRLTIGMGLDVDATLQYARGDTGEGWWAPITHADEKINSPYNTYLHAGLPPTPIANPGVEAIEAALDPATTTCLYYLHDTMRQIHCATTYTQQQENVQTYLK